MLGKLTLRSVIERHPVDSQLQFLASEAYLVNTDNIIEVEDESTLAITKIRVKYKFNVYMDRTGEFEFTVDDSVASIRTLADATAASPKILLNVYEKIQTFDKISSDTSVACYFNVADIVWGENDTSGAYARIWTHEGGNKLTPYIVNHNIDQIVDLADTGTTTTTTSSTSTTSTTTSS